MWVEVEDIISRWVGDEEPHPDEYSKIEVLIGDVEDEIVREFPGIAARVDTPQLTLTTVKRVVYNVIRRVWSLGGNYHSSFQESFGPQSLGGSISGSQERGIYLTESEKNTLMPRKQSIMMMGVAAKMRVPSDSNNFHEEKMRWWV